MTPHEADNILSWIADYGETSDCYETVLTPDEKKPLTRILERYREGLLAADDDAMKSAEESMVMIVQDIVERRIQKTIAFIEGDISSAFAELFSGKLDETPLRELVLNFLFKPAAKFRRPQYTRAQVDEAVGRPTAHVLRALREKGYVEREGIERPKRPTYYLYRLTVEGWEAVKKVGVRNATAPVTPAPVTPASRSKILI